MATFTNQATLTYNGQTVNSNTVTGQMISPLTMTKTTLDDVYATGDTITYVVSLVNDGSTTYDDLTLTDNLGSSEVGGEEMSYPLSYVPNSIRYFINGVLQSAPTVSPEEPLTVTGISVPAGGNTMLIYETEVTAAAPLTAGSVICDPHRRRAFLHAGGRGDCARGTRPRAAYRQEPLPGCRARERSADLFLPDPELRQ